MTQPSFDDLPLPAPETEYDSRLLDDLRVVLDRRAQSEGGSTPQLSPVGSKIGPYEIKKLLGEGGMAHVYHAIDTTVHRDVALKVLKRELQASGDICARFEQEARSMGRIQHPNVVRILSSLKDDGATAIAMELLTGGSLRDLLAVGAKRRKRMDIRALSRFALQTAQGLAAAHAVGIVHRDIKPSNLLLDADATVKIADFGVVLALERATWLTGLGRPIGTPAYMSPEQCKGERVGAASDIYSFGVTLFELATGMLPFTEQAESPFALMLKQIREPAPDPRQFRPSLPGWFARLLLKCLEKEPAARFDDGAALAAAIVAGPKTDEPEPIKLDEQRTGTRLDTVAIREQLKRLPQRAIVAWACRCARRSFLFNRDPRLARSLETAESTLYEESQSSESEPLSQALLKVQRLRSASFNVLDTNSIPSTPDSATCAALAAAAACACAAARCAADAAADAAFAAEKSLTAHALAGRSVSDAWRAAQADYRALLAANLGPEGTVGAPLQRDFWGTG
jgi:serine/threonine protein kinase